MPHQKVTIGPNDFPTWGKLVKTWATGRNYVDHVMTEEDPVPTTDEVPPKYPKPKSFEEFWDQCVRAGVGLIFDDGLNTQVKRDAGIGLIVMQSDTDVFGLRLPAEDTLKHSEARFLAAATYQLPDFYKDMFGGPPQATSMDTKV
jgi:hypothetical protein